MSIKQNKGIETTSNNKKALNKVSMREHSRINSKKRAKRKESINLTTELKEGERLIFETDIKLHQGKTDIHLDPQGNEVKSNRDVRNIRKCRKG